ncbi:MAG: hypothetical protein WA057_01150 [Candidatus Magasanikiibacteriota bacterium]
MPEEKLLLNLCRDINDIEIRFKLADKKGIKAFFSLSFGDLSVKGFRIQDSKFEDPVTRNLWIVPPVFFDQNKQAHPIAYFSSKEKWEALQEYIIKKYDEAVDHDYFDKTEEEEIEKIVSAI